MSEQRALGDDRGERPAMDETTRALLAAREGDRSAFAAFVRDTQGEVWRFCASLVDRDHADDLTQDVYVRAMRAAPRFRGDASARTWLLTIARRTCADAIRSRQRRRGLQRRLPAPASHRDDHTSVEMEGLLARVDPDRREAFVLTQLLGYTYADAAEIAGVPVGTIRSRVARAREELIAALSNAESLTSSRR